MFHKKIPARQLSAWLFAAITPVLIKLSAGTSWLVLGITAIVCSLAAWCVWKWGSQIRNRWVSLLQCVFIIILIGNLVSESAGSWPGDNYPAVPLILLALAAWSAQKGPSAAARVGTVLFWFVIIMYLVVFGAGVKDIQPKWLTPQWAGPDWNSVVLLLTPAVAAVLLKQDEKWGPRLLLPAAFLLGAAIIVAGVLSPDVAEKTENTFYEMSRSLNLLGVAKRFEAVISAGMTVGWFALLTLYLTICGRFLENAKKDMEKSGVWIGAVGAAAWMLFGMHISGEILAIIAAVFWVGIPILTQGIGAIKKS